jgi:hypothetical protein
VDFGYAFTVGANVNYVYFDYFVDFNWEIIKAATAFVLGVSWGTFFGTDETSYLVYTINIVSSLKALRLAKSRKAGRLMFCRKQNKEKDCLGLVTFSSEGKCCYCDKYYDEGGAYSDVDCCRCCAGWWNYYNRTWGWSCCLPGRWCGCYYC